MTEQEFSAHMREWLPSFSEKAMAAWVRYAQELDTDGTEPLQIFFDCFFVI